MKTFSQFINYLKESINDLAAEFFCKIRESADIAHHIHLNTDSYAQHKALDEYYNGVIGLLDSFMEAFIGRYGKIGEYNKNYEMEKTDPIKLLKDIRSYIDETRHSLGSESELQNLIDSIVELLNKTINKLENLK